MTPIIDIDKNTYFFYDKIKKVIIRIIYIKPAPASTSAGVPSKKYEVGYYGEDGILYSDIVDEKLGLKSSSNTSIPFRIAFNSLLNKKLINHY